MMSEEKLWKTWKARWKSTEKSAINIVEEIYRLGGTRPVERKKLIAIAQLEDALSFAIEMGWLNDCFTGSYKLTCSGLLMLSHRVKG